MATLIIDYGMGNLASVKRAFEECGANVFISDDPADIETSERLVLPGVGAFYDAMALLRKRGWVDAIRHAVLEEGVPILGICLGMQLMAESGVEGGETDGLGLVPGTVSMLSSNTSERIPHVGWNEVHIQRRHSIFDGVSDGTDFYFVHSFHFIPSYSEHILAITPYCGRFVSVVGKGSAIGVQFHPEKSSKAGFRIITNFLGYKPC